jgi:outer membrane biogenesis lipoprotein LolB
MTRRFAMLAIALTLSACAARTPARPAGNPGPDPTAVDAFTNATSACRGFRSLTAELSLSGRASGERIRGRVIAGLESGGSVRLEGVAPFGPPVFILAGKAEKATLLLPREQRVLKDTAVSAVLERLTGLAFGADDLRLMVSGCLADNAAPTEGQQWPGGWQAVRLGADRVAYIRTQQGRPVVVAADYGPWHVDYSEHVSGYPRVVRVRRSGDATTDITARVGELEVNTTINPLAFTLAIPPDADPMTLDELRSVAPLVPKEP